MADITKMKKVQVGSSFSYDDKTYNYGFTVVGLADDDERVTIVIDNDYLIYTIQMDEIKDNYSKKYLRER